MTEAMPFLQKYDITFLRPPTIPLGTLGPFLSLTISAMRVFYWLRHQNTRTTHFSECKYQRAICRQVKGDPVRLVVAGLCSCCIIGFQFFSAAAKAFFRAV